MPNRTRFTGNLVSDNNIFSDIVNDRVGIGTTTPNSKLQVVGVVSATSYFGDGANLTIPKFLTIGVRTGTAVTFSISNNTFNVINRSGGSTSVSINL